MLPDRVSNPEPLTYESGALPIALRGPASGVRVPLYHGHSQRKAEPIPLLLLPYFSLIRKSYPFTAGLTEQVFQQS